MSKKYIFKKSLFAWIDMLKTKKLPLKCFKAIQANNLNQDIKNNYHVNTLAKQLHPKQQLLKLIKIIDETDDTKSFIFTSGNEQRLAYFRSGQYLSISILFDDILISRPYTISSSPQAALNNYYRITIKKKEQGLFSEYFFNQAKINDIFIASGPEGNFYYESLRDPNHIIAIAQGSGITPFISLAQAINDGTEDFNLTILYAAKDLHHIIFKEELDKICLSTNKVKVNYFLVHESTNQQSDNIFYERINLSTIKKYYQRNDAIWLCTSKMMNKIILNEMQELNIQKKLIRYELHNHLANPESYSNYDNIGHKQTYFIKVKQFDHHYEIKANANETILVALQRANIYVQTKCLAGTCSWCRFKIIKGEVFLPDEYDWRRRADTYQNVYFSCVSFPITDLEIELY